MARDAAALHAASKRTETASRDEHAPFEATRLAGRKLREAMG